MPQETRLRRRLQEPRGGFAGAFAQRSLTKRSLEGWRRSGTPTSITPLDSTSRGTCMLPSPDSATSNIVTVLAEASLEQAAEKMIKGGFRHLLVIASGDAIGIVSMRDLIVAFVEQ